MKYHYQIVSSFDPTDIHSDSSNQSTVENGVEADFKGYNTRDMADHWGEQRMRLHELNPDQYYVKVFPVAENIEEEDMLEGHAYPGHETWED